MTKLMQDTLTDFISLAENEIQAIETGKAPGPRMRDIIGQWKATVREAKQAIAEARILLPLLTRQL